MRITGGKLCSRTVQGPDRDMSLRPTPDALREQAFQVLLRDLEGAVFLDLFAGTGVASLEALSRGAERVVLCERSAAAHALIRRNFSALGIAANVWELLPGPVERTLPRLAARGVRAGVTWCDPPFAEWPVGVAALVLARELGVLGQGALVVLETPAKQVVSIPGFEFARALRGAVLLRLV
jgi:16S rRNA (guanine966-N2)-methyltransferase